MRRVVTGEARDCFQKCLPVLRLVGPGPRPTLFRLFHVAGGQQIKTPVDLIHKLVGQCLEPLVATQKIVERVLKEFFTYDVVALAAFEFFLQERYVPGGNRPQPFDAGAQQGARAGQIEIAGLMS